MQYLAKGVGWGGRFKEKSTAAAIPLTGNVGQTDGQLPLQLLHVTLEHQKVEEWDQNGDEQSGTTN